MGTKIHNLTTPSARALTAALATEGLCHAAIVMIARKAQVKLLKEHKKFSNVQFDGLQTFEHTKLKPLAIGLIVETKTRFVMGMRVSTQPSNCNLVKVSLKKYGKRKDGRPEGWDILWGGLTQYMTEDVTITTDKNPMYPSEYS